MYKDCLFDDVICDIWLHVKWVFLFLCYPCHMKFYVYMHKYKLEETREVKRCDALAGTDKITNCNFFLFFIFLVVHVVRICTSSLEFCAVLGEAQMYADIGVFIREQLCKQSLSQSYALVPVPWSTLHAAREIYFSELTMFLPSAGGEVRKRKLANSFYFTRASRKLSWAVTCAKWNRWGCREHFVNNLGSYPLLFLCVPCYSPYVLQDGKKKIRGGHSRLLTCREGESIIVPREKYFQVMFLHVL